MDEHMTRFNSSEKVRKYMTSLYARIWKKERLVKNEGKLTAFGAEASVRFDAAADDVCGREEDITKADRVGTTLLKARRDCDYVSAIYKPIDIKVSSMFGVEDGPYPSSGERTSKRDYQ
jgi:hypothetical protein